MHSCWGLQYADVNTERTWPGSRVAVCLLGNTHPPELSLPAVRSSLSALSLQFLQLSTDICQYASLSLSASTVRKWTGSVRHADGGGITGRTWMAQGPQFTQVWVTLIKFLLIRKAIPLLFNHLIPGKHLVKDLPFTLSQICHTALPF